MKRILLTLALTLVPGYLQASDINNQINEGNAQEVNYADYTDISTEISVNQSCKLNFGENNDGYIVTQKISGSSATADAGSTDNSATISAISPVRFQNTVNLSGNVKANFEDTTTFDTNSSLTIRPVTTSGSPTNTLVPQITLKNNLVLLGNVTIDTDKLANLDNTYPIKFDNGNEASPKLDISKLTDNTDNIINLVISGKDASHKSEIIYYTPEQFKQLSANTGVEDFRRNLLFVMEHMTTDNMFMTDIYVSPQKRSIIGEKDNNTQLYKFKVGTSDAEKLLDSYPQLKTLLEDNVGITINVPTEELPVDNNSLDFYNEMNSSQLIGNATKIPNKPKHIFYDWNSNIKYSLSNSQMDNNSFTFALDILPEEAKTLNLTVANNHSTQPDSVLKTVQFLGATNANLTVKLYRTLDTLVFSPMKASYCKIDAKSIASDLNIKILGSNYPTEFTIDSVPEVAPGHTYSLEIGNNVTVILSGNDIEYNFSKIKTGVKSLVKVNSGAILNT